MAMDKDSLVNLIVKDIISEIITSLTTFISHDTITINGLEGIKLVWDSTGFKFAELFPLAGKYTDFNYEIVYHIEKDSIINDGQDTIVVAEYDSTIYVDYTVEIDDGNSVSDSVKLTWWGRSLEFYHNGTIITSADETMDQLEVRFTEYEVDTLYGYQDVKVEITHVQGATQDTENFTLTDNGSYFSYTFARTIGNPSPGDNTLQHQKPDSIVAVFRNPKLPLDTLRVAIPFGGILPWPQISNAVVLDQDGNGIPDYLEDVMGIPGGPNFVDEDGDGLPDFAQDDDGDGIPNCQDEDSHTPADCDGDGVPNDVDEDNDNDGVPDYADAAPCDPEVS